MARLRPFARARNIVILLAVLLVFNLVLFPARSASLRATTGLDDVIPDAMFGYSADKLFALYEKMSHDGRALYAVSEFTLDLAFPILLFLFLTLLLLALTERAFAPDSVWQALAYLPIGLLAFDLLENASQVVLLAAHPLRLNGLAALASLFTQVKWVFGALVLSAVLVAGGIAIVKATRARARAKNP